MKGICPKCGGLLMPGTPSCRSKVCRQAEIEMGDPVPGDVGGARGTIQPAKRTAREPSVSDGSGETNPPDPYSAFRPREKPVTSAASDGSGDTKPSSLYSGWQEALKSKEPNAVGDFIRKHSSGPRRGGHRPSLTPPSPPVAYRRPPPPPQPGFFDRVLLGMSMLMNLPCPHCRTQ